MKINKNELLIRFKGSGFKVADSGFRFDWRRCASSFNLIPDFYIPYFNPISPLIFVDKFDFGAKKCLTN